MKNIFPRVAKIGLLLAFTLTVTVVYILYATDRFSSRDFHTLHADLDSAKGLVRNAPVSFRGIPVGKIESIEFQGKRVRVYFLVNEAVRIPVDSVVQVVARSLFGETELAIIPGTSTIMVDDSSILASTGSGSDMSQLMSSLAPILEDFEVISEAVKQNIDISSDLVKENLFLLRDLLATVNRIGSAIDDQTQSQLARISLLLDEATGSFQKVNTWIDSNETTLSAATSNIHAITEDLHTIIQDIQGSKGTIGKLITDDSLYTSLTSTGEALENFIRPTLESQLQVGYRAETMTASFQDVAVKSHAGIRWVPPGNRGYYSFDLVWDPRYSGNPDEKFKISAQIAKPVFTDKLILRGGLIEGSGGFGLEYRPIPQLEVGMEMFEFGVRNGAYLRTWVNVFPVYDPNSHNILNWLYVNVGVDDILANYNRRYFAGLGIRFTDQQMRGILMLAPGLSNITK